MSPSAIPSLADQVSRAFAPDGATRAQAHEAARRTLSDLALQAFDGGDVVTVEEAARRVADAAIDVLRQAVGEAPF